MVRTVIRTVIPKEMTDHGGDRLISRVYQTNPELGEVRRVTLTATDYRMEAQHEQS